MGDTRREAIIFPRRNVSAATSCRSTCEQKEVCESKTQPNRTLFRIWWALSEGGGGTLHGSAKVAGVKRMKRTQIAGAKPRERASDIAPPRILGDVRRRSKFFSGFLYSRFPVSVSAASPGHSNSTFFVKRVKLSKCFCSHRLAVQAPGSDILDQSSNPSEILFLLSYFLGNLGLTTSS